MSQAIDDATPCFSRYLRDTPCGGPLRLMQPGSHDQPLFLIPGADGSAFALHPLARQIGGGRAVYAFQSIGLDGRTAPLASIEAIAAAYLDELRRVQPAGPYAIAGHGMGGLIAFELAQRLAAAGQKVAPLMLIDPQFSSGKLGETWRPALQNQLDGLRHLIRSASPAKLFSRARGAWNGLTDVNRLQIHLTRAVDIRFFGGPHPDEAAILAKVCRANNAAERAYRPRSYSGDIIVLQSDRNRSAGLDPLVWRRLARSLDVLRVPADQLAETIASLLRSHAADIRRASSPTPPWSGLTARRHAAQEAYCVL